MRKTFTGILDLFRLQVLKFQWIIEETPKHIETNVTDGVIAELQKRTQRDKEMFEADRQEYKATRRLA